MNASEKIKSVIDDYDDIAKDYCAEFANSKVYNEYIDDFLKNVKSGKILDAGCGCGNACYYINQNEEFQAVGIDISSNMLLEGKKRFPSVETYNMDMSSMDFKDNTFDGLLSNCSLVHVPFENVFKTLREFNRVIKPGGNLLLIVLEGNNEGLIKEPYRDNVFVYTKFFNEIEVINLLNDNGFRVENIKRRITSSDNSPGSSELIIYATSKKGNTNE